MSAICACRSSWRHGSRVAIAALAFTLGLVCEIAGHIQALAQQPSPNHTPAATDQGIPLRGKLVDFSKCKMYYPEEIMDNKLFFQKSYKLSDFDNGYTNTACASDGYWTLDPNAKYGVTFTMRHPVERHTILDIKMKGKMVKGRFQGPVELSLLAWRVPLASVIGPAFKGKDTVYVYFGNDRVYLDKATYERPIIEAKKRHEEIQNLESKRSAALVALSCDAVKELDAKLGHSPKFESCLSAAADKKKKDESDAALLALEKQRNEAFAARKCDEVKRLDALIRSSDRHNDCLFEFQLSSSSARELYLEAGKYERAGNRDRARRLYTAIVENHAKDDLAIKATDSLNALARAEGIERSNANAAAAAQREGQASREAAERAQRDQSNSLERAQRDAKEQQQRACYDRKRACEGRCDSLSSNLNRRYECKQGCERCIF